MYHRLKLLVSIIFTLDIICSNHAFGEEENASSSQEEKGDPGRGAKAWAENCGRCHNRRGPQEFRPAQWQPIMLHMRIQAGLTGQTARDIFAFLTGESPEPSAPQEAPSAQETTTTPQEAVLVSEKKAHIQPASEVQPVEKSKPHEMKSSEIKTAFKEHPQEKAASQSAYNEGKQIFETQGCVACHGANGKGTMSQVPDFTAPNSVLKKGDEELAKIIKEGGPKHIMPAHPSLKQQQINDVLIFLKQKFAPK